MRKLILAALASFVAGQGVAQEEIKFSSFVNRMHIVDQTIIAPMQEAYKKLVGDLSEIVVYDSMSLAGPGRAQWDLVVAGGADMTFSLPTYTQDVHALTLQFELPGLYKDTVEGTNVLWDNIDFFDHDFAGMKIIALWFFDAPALITRDKPVYTLADIRGMKIRVTSPAHARIIKAWGGNPVFSPLPEAYGDLESGKVDALYIAATAMEDFKFYEPANFVTVNLPPTLGLMYIVMDEDKYNSLSEVERNAIDSLSGREPSLKIAEQFQNARPRAIELARANGVQIIELTPFQVQAFTDRFPFTVGQSGE